MNHRPLYCESSELPKNALSRHIRSAAAYTYVEVWMNSSQSYAAALLVVVVCEDVHRLLRAHKMDGVLQSHTQLARTL